MKAAVLGTSAKSNTPKASSGPPIGNTPRGSGIEFEHLPTKYHRRLITEEEMEAIQVCNYKCIINVIIIRVSGE